MGCVLCRESCFSSPPTGPKNRDKVEIPQPAADTIEAPKPEIGADSTSTVGKNRQRNERKQKPNPRRGNFSRQAQGDQINAGWPPWLSVVAGEAINGMVPRRADSFEKIVKVRKFLPFFFFCFSKFFSFSL